MISNAQEEVIQLIVNGENISTIARKLNKSRQTIYTWIKNPEFKAEIELRQQMLKQQARDKINSNILTCIDHMKELALTSTDPRVKLQALKYLLDRSLGTPTAEKNDTVVVEDDKNKDINSLKKEFAELKKLQAVK